MFLYNLKSEMIFSLTERRIIMKRLFAVASALVLIGAVTFIPGRTVSVDDNSLKVVTTIFPVYDWVREVVGDQTENIDVDMLLDKGVDLHSFQPSADDIMEISTCDVFVYVGGESDAWVHDALGEATNKDMKVINLLEVLGSGAREEELVEGMEGGHDHDHEDGEDHDHEDDEDHEDEDHDHEDGEDHDHEDEDHDHEDGELDEHVWLSLRNAEIFVNTIAGVLGEADPGHAADYTANAAAYNEKLETLDKAYQDAVKAGSTDTVLFADRFPFRYLVDDYDLDYYAAFSGCSAETEASFKTIIFLADKVNELGLRTILTIEGSDSSLAETVRESSEAKDQQIAEMNSMQNTAADDVENGVTYLAIMEENLEVLKAALQ